MDMWRRSKPPRKCRQKAVSKMASSTDVGCVWKNMLLTEEQTQRSALSDHDFTLKVTAEGSEARVGNFLTTANFVCHSHVTRDTFENVAPQGRRALPAKRRDKARLKRLAVCCSSYHESALSEDVVPREPELEEPPPGGVGLAGARFPQLLSHVKSGSR